jgi:hypothetical protein
MPTNNCPHNNVICTCPHTACENWGKCCVCVAAHKAHYSVTMCMKLMLKEKEEKGIETINPHKKP